jgi:hypothetical protein
MKSRFSVSVIWGIVLGVVIFPVFFFVAAVISNPVAPCPLTIYQNRDRTLLVLHNAGANTLNVTLQIDSSFELPLQRVAAGQDTVIRDTAIIEWFGVGEKRMLAHFSYLEFSCGDGNGGYWSQRGLAVFEPCHETMLRINLQ